MLHVIIEYTNMVRDLTMDRVTFVHYVQPQLEADDNVVNYRYEVIE